MIKEGDLVLCTVREVTNTVTTVTIDGDGEGTIVSSEIAPGRIKFLRQYVVPNKKIVCKVLGISGGHVHLSLRRVSSKEKKEVLERFKQEKSVETALKQIFGEKVEGIRNKILKDYKSVYDFINDARKDEKVVEKYIPKENLDAIKKIVEKRKKSHEIKYLIKLSCAGDDGIIKIKKLFDIDDENVLVSYVSAGNYRLKLTTEDFKEGKKKISELLEKLEKDAKKNGCEFFANEEKS